MDKIKRLAARLRGGAKGKRQPLLSEEMDIECAQLVSEAAGKIDNEFDAAGFVVAVLLEFRMNFEARAVSELLAGSERVQAAKELVRGTPYLERPTECKRCGSELRKGYCVDATCPFSDRLQSDPEGWHGHPDRPTASRRGRRNGADWGPLGVPSLDKTWYCHDCDESIRFPLKGADGTTTGCPTCKSCGKPMVTDVHLKDRDAPRRAGRTGQVDAGPPTGAAPRDSMKWYCHDCGTSKRHPLADGCPACVSCGRPMVSDTHLKDRGGPINVGGPPRHLKGR